MTPRILSPANEELADTIAFLEARRAGLGLEFADAFDAAVAEILEHPNRWEKSSEKSRSYLMRKFKFRIHYGISDDEVVIAAIAHPSREEGYWLDRL